MRLLIFLLLMLSCPVLVLSQEKNTAAKSKMQVDLPDETEETDILEKGQFQLETGFLYNQYQDGQPSAIGIGMLRYGLNKRIEIRALVEDGSRRDKYIEETVQSTSPFAIGAKVVLIKDKPKLPDVTLVTYLKLPITSRSEDQSAYWSPIFLLAFKNELSEKWKLEYNGGIQQEAFGPSWFWLANASLHYEISDKVEVFGEYFGQYQQEEEPVHNAGLGVCYQAGENWELFLSGASTINHDPCNYFANAGISFRLN